MSDIEAPARDETTGQFASSEPLYGKEREEADQGFKPMKTAEDDNLPLTFDNAKEAGDILAMARQDETDEAVPIEMKRIGSGKKAPANETLTVEQAAQALSAYRAGETADFAKSLGADFAAEIDKLRADVPAEDGEQKPVEAKSEKPEPVTEPKPGELDAEIEKALKHPQVREAVEQELGKAAQAHQQYSSAVNVAQQFAVASFMEQFPELGQLAPEHLQAGLEELSQINPERFNSAVRMLQRASDLQQEQIRLQQQNAEQRRQEVAEYRKQQSAKYDEYGLKSDQRTVDAAREYFAEIGITAAEMASIETDAPYLFDARFQRVIYDAVQHRLMQKAKGEVLKKPLPTVLRPGVSRSAGEISSEHMGALSARLSSSGSLKDAVALRQAQIRSRG